MKTLSESLNEGLSKDDKKLAKIVKDSSDSEIAQMLLDKKIKISDIIHLLTFERAKSIANILEPKLK